MWSYEMKERNTYRDVERQSGRHRGQRAAPKNSGRYAERERERRIADRRDITRIEDQRGEAVGVHRIDGTRPPRQHPTHQPAGQHACSTDDGEFRRYPSLPRYTLCPRQPIRSRFEFARNKRSTPEQSRSAGKSKLKAWAKGKYVSCPLVSELVIDSQSLWPYTSSGRGTDSQKCGPVMRKTTATATRRPKTTRA